MDTTLVQKLMAFGLAEKEAELYLELLREGPMSAGRLASHLGIPRMQVYRITKTMVDRNLISVEISKPQRFVANPINVVIEDFLGELKGKIKGLEASTQEIMKGLGSLSRAGVEEDKYTFRLVEGRRNAYGIIRRTAEKATRRFDLILEGEDLPFASLEGVDDSLISCGERGVPVRLITEVTPLNVEVAKRVAQTCDLRHATSPSGRMLVVDGRECFVSLVLKKERPDEEVSLWTDGIHFVNLMEKSFEERFSLSEDGRETIKTIEAKTGSYRVYTSMLELIKQRLATLGLGIKSPALLRGRSGMSHEYALEIKNPKDPDKTLIADVYVSSGDALDAESLMKPVFKLLDVAALTKVIIAVPDADRKATDLCKFFGISMISGEPTSTADEFLRLARARLLG